MSGSRRLTNWWSASIRPILRSGRANFVLFDRHSFEHDALRIGAIAGLVGRPPTVRTGKAHDVTLPLGHGIGEPLKEALRLLGLTAEITRRRGGGCGT